MQPDEFSATSARMTLDRLVVVLACPATDTLNARLVTGLV